MRSFFLIAVLSLFRLGAADLPEVLARFGDTEIKGAHFSHFSLPSASEEKKAVLKKLVDAEIHLTIVRQLLERSGIPPSPDTAERYISFRKNQNGSRFSKSFEATLRSSASNKDFQLKCALFFTFYVAAPTAVDPDKDAIIRHYLLNKDKFRTPGESRFSVFRAGNDDEKGQKQSSLILARLRQGEDFLALAREFDPEGRQRNNTLPEGQKHFFNVLQDIPVNQCASIKTPAGIFIVKVTSRQPSRNASLEEARPYIRELLSGMMLKSALEQYMREILAKNPVRYFF